MRNMPDTPDNSSSTTTTRRQHAALPGARPSHTSWIVSLTAVCFIFGGLLAAQLRAVERVRADRENKVAGQDEAQARLKRIQAQARAEEARSLALRTQLNNLKSALANRTSLSAKQTKQLTAQISELQMVSGLIPVTGPGVVVRLSDNQDAAKAGGSNPFLPGIVHDFDLLQVVNELRAAKAEAIAVNGRRITGYSPIRCVGPVIYVNWEAAAPPFVVQAIGDTDTLTSALKMPNGILDNLKNQGGLGIRISSTSSMTLPAVDSTPRLHVAKTTPVTRTN